MLESEKWIISFPLNTSVSESGVTLTDLALRKIR